MLTAKQKRFCDEYIIDLNATQAAIRAGYSPNGINKRITRMMANDGINAEIQRAMAERGRRTEITQDMVLKELADIAFDDIGKYLEFKTVETLEEFMGEKYKVYKTIAAVSDSKDVDTKNIQEVSIGRDGQFKFKLYNKATALELVGKHLGMFSDKDKKPPSMIEEDDELFEAIREAVQADEV